MVSPPVSGVLWLNGTMWSRSVRAAGIEQVGKLQCPSLADT
jgi:hypothetical protein